MILTSNLDAADLKRSDHQLKPPEALALRIRSEAARYQEYFSV